MSLTAFILEAIFSFIEAVIILMIFTIVIDKKNFIFNNITKSILFFIFYTVFTTWASMYLPKGFHTIAISVFLILVLSYILKVSMFSSVIIVGITAFVIGGTSTLVSALLMIVLSMDINEMLFIHEYKLMHFIAEKTVQAIIVLVFYKKEISLFKSHFFRKEKLLATIGILQAFMIGVFILSVGFVISQRSNIIAYNILLYTIFLFVIVFAIIESREREKVLRVQEKAKSLEELIQNMEAMISIIRREKHDFSNHLNTIYAICTLNRPDAVKRIHNYIANLSEQLKESYHFYDTGNEYVDGLLAVKSSMAYEKNILFEVETDERLNKINVNDNDLTSIIGNIIDNAFEALISFDSKDEKKILSFYTSRENTKLCISISDNGPPIPSKIMNKIFESGFSTKTKMKEDHGFGLYIVKNLVQKNNGTIDVRSNDLETEFIIKFKIMEKQNEKNSYKAG